MRVGEEIRHVLAELFVEGRLHDPELADLRITVTEVKVSPDLKNASAFVVPFGGGDPEALAQSLNHAAPFLRGEIAHALKLRFAPQIRFHPDKSFDRAQRLDQLFHSPEIARDLGETKDDGRGPNDQDGDDEGGER
ncbi:30S ribosome-binding factor RbfA [Hypericibacter terrae]|uniref:30S ribosome-binding factor RbfA n=1 Tax=Hypericibacter terrae TaxID=2602015 RepID=UPI0021E68AE6|nr:30S ribosome-binding factor RbfA [Hypericibacter terrae]